MHYRQTEYKYKHRKGLKVDTTMPTNDPIMLELT